MGDRQKELLELLETSGPHLMALLTKLTLREDVAEELMQDLFVKLNGARTPGDPADLFARQARRACLRQPRAGG